MVGLKNNAVAMVYAGDVVRGRTTRYRRSSYLYDHLVAPQQCNAEVSWVGKQVAKIAQGQYHAYTKLLQSQTIAPLQN